MKIIGIKSKILLVSHFLMHIALINGQSTTMNIHRIDGFIDHIPMNNIDSVTYTPGGELGNAWLNPVLMNYGNVVDQNGNSYATIVIGNQEWMAENLRASTYANGDPIPNVTSASQWSNLISGAWVHYDNNGTNEIPYGKLYNWYAVADSRNVCPSGWRVPLESDWTILTDFLGGNINNGGKLKSVGTQYWSVPNSDASNEFGYSGLPGGGRDDYGVFGNINDYGYWWSASENVWDNTEGTHRYLYWNPGNVFGGPRTKKNGFSVRCVRN